MERCILRSVPAEVPPGRPIATCPRFQPAGGTGLYPVGGYCLLSRYPGFMIPSIAESRDLCRTARYRDCPHFAAPEGAAEAEWNELPRAA